MKNWRQCHCGARWATCRECGSRFHHGEASRCGKVACREANAALDCMGCAQPVSDKLDGVLSPEMDLIPYRPVEDCS